MTTTAIISTIICILSIAAIVVLDRGNEYWKPLSPLCRFLVFVMYSSGAVAAVSLIVLVVNRVFL